MVTSLSFHSVIAGLTLGLEKETAGVWINFGAIALHKFVIAFSVGVELVTSQVIFFLFTMGVYGDTSCQVLKWGDTKSERFLPKNQHNQCKLLNFENWCSREVSKSAKIRLQSQIST